MCVTNDQLCIRLRPAQANCKQNLYSRQDGSLGQRHSTEYKHCRFSWAVHRFRTHLNRQPAKLYKSCTWQLALAAVEAVWGKVHILYALSISHYPAGKCRLQFLINS